MSATLRSESPPSSGLGIVAGRPLIVNFGSGSGRVMTTVAAVTDGSVLLDVGVDGLTLPDAGDRLSFMVGGRRFDVDVERSSDRWVTVRRPDGLMVDESRRGLRVRTKLLASWRAADSTDPGRSIYLVDLSVNGARVLVERHDDDVVGAEMDLIYDGEVGRAVIRWAGDHEHHMLRFCGVELTSVSSELLQRIIRRIGRLRSNPANWA